MNQMNNNSQIVRLLITCTVWTNLITRQEANEKELKRATERELKKYEIRLN